MAYIVSECNNDSITRPFSAIKTVYESFRRGEEINATASASAELTGSDSVDVRSAGSAERTE